MYSKEHIFSAGDRVEVFGNSPKYSNCFLAAKVVGLTDKGVGVEYETFLGDDGDTITEVVPYGKVRPYPGTSNAMVHSQEAVEYWDGEVWRTGTCVGVEDRYYVIYAKTVDGTYNTFSYPKHNVRRSMVWKKKEGKSCWMYGRAH